MRLIGFSLLFGALMLSARGDLTIVQKMEGAGPVSEMIIKIKSDKERVDISPFDNVGPKRISVIVDEKTGEMINLIHDEKIVIRMSAEKMKAAAEMVRQFSGKEEKKETDEKPKLASTGKKEVINGYEAEEYVYETSQFKASCWIAPKYPDGAAILKQLQSVHPTIWKAFNTKMPDYRDFPGLPIKTVISGGKKEIISTLVSVKQDPLSDADFAIPPDYQEMKVPDMSGLLQQKSAPATSPKP